VGWAECGLFDLGGTLNFGLNFAANAAIEQMPVFARSGDTLQTIAALYHLPLWSLSQINKGG
jgi:hypothetical protein